MHVLHGPQETWRLERYGVWLNNALNSEKGAMSMQTMHQTTSTISPQRSARRGSGRAYSLAQEGRHSSGSFRVACLIMQEMKGLET